MKKSMFVSGFAVTFAVVAVATAGDAPPPPAINFNMNVGQSTLGWTDGNGVSQGDGSFTYSGGQNPGSDPFGMTYVIQADSDPFISFSYEFFNNTGSTQNYSVTTNMPVGAWGFGSLTGASMGGSLTDTDLSGSATLSTIPNTPMMMGLIDGVQWASLFNDPFTLQANAFPGQTVTLGPADTGLPGPTNPGPNVITTDMAVTLNFSLTAGDRVSFTGFFIVTLVPAPAGAFALVGLAGMRRRRV